MRGLNHQQRRDTRGVALRIRAEEGWLGNPALLQAWPERPGAAGRRVPPGVVALGENLAAKAQREADPFSAQNMNENDGRAVGKDHVKTKGLRAYHFPDGELGKRVVALSIDDVGGNISGGRLEGRSVHGDKIVPGTMPYEDLRDKPPFNDKINGIATEMARLRKRVAALEKRR